MMWYETLMLARPDITGDEETKIRNYFEQLVSKQQGELISFEKWGKYLLVYPVKKHDYGTYFLVRFALPEDVVTSSLEDMKTFFKIKAGNIVMRYTNKKLSKGFSLDYQKPEPIDSEPSPIFTRDTREKNRKKKEDSKMQGKEAVESGGVDQEKVVKD